MEDAPAGTACIFCFSFANPLFQDPGSAPVLGERVKYVIALNGERQITTKAEPIGLKLPVDRHFYLSALRKAVDGLFLPIIEQRLLAASEPKPQVLLFCFSSQICLI